MSRRHRRDLGVSDTDLAKIRARCAAGTPVLGLRFTGDRTSPGERFARLREELGDRFLAIEIDSSRGNPHGVPRNAHSVVTHHLVDEPGHPTRIAIVELLRDDREVPVTTIHERLGLEQANVSQHLTVLRSP